MFKKGLLDKGQRVKDGVKGFEMKEGTFKDQELVQGVLLQGPCIYLHKKAETIVMTD